MTTKLALLTTTLVLASSSVAMADSSFSFSGRASASWGTAPSPSVRYTAPIRPYATTPVVRDHRTFDSRYAYDDRYDRRFDDRRFDGRFDDRIVGRPLGDRPSTYKIAGLDCRNWDPILDLSSACAVFATAQPHVTSHLIHDDRYSPWSLLASREASVPDVEYITVERPLRQLKIDVMSGRPAIKTVRVKFMDGSLQSFELGRLSRGSTVLDIAGRGSRTISQVVFYTAPSSYGVYSVSGL